jgi:hypothetical protein
MGGAGLFRTVAVYLQAVRKNSPDGGKKKER